MVQVYDYHQQSQYVRHYVPNRHLEHCHDANLKYHYYEG